MHGMDDDHDHDEYDENMDKEGDHPESGDESNDLSCDMCDYEATHRQGLNSHKKRVHGTTCVKCAQGIKN